MELSEVSEKDEEYVRLYLEEQLGDRNVQYIHYCPDKQTVVVAAVDDCAVDNLLKGSQSFCIDEKSYRARRLYNVELLDTSDAELALSYLDTYIGNVVHHEHFPGEQRLVVAFEAAKAIEKLCEQEHHVIEDGVKFRVKRVSKSQQARQQPIQQQGSMVQQLNWQKESQRRQQFMQQKRQQQQQEYVQQQAHPQQQIVRQQEQQIVRQQQQQQRQVHVLARDTDLQAEHYVTMSGIPDTMSKPALELELTKQWKKAGVNYRHIDYNPCSGLAVVKFTAAEDVHKVLLDRNSEGIPWSITACDGFQRVCDLLGDVVLCIDNISPEFSTEALWCWMKIVVGEFAHMIVYSSSYTMAAGIFVYFADLNLDLVASRAKMHAVDGHRLHVTAIRHTKKAQAINLPEKVSLSILKKHLEDFQKGDRPGNVACVEMTRQCAAVITFSNEYALSHAMSQKQVLLGQEILLVPLFDDVGPVTSSQQVFNFADMKRAIIDADAMTSLLTELTVTGFDREGIDEWALHQFLSQRNMSGGGEIRSFKCSKGKAVVTFVDSECATRVYQKCQFEGLQLCGCRLTASLRTFDIDDDAHKKQVLLRNIGVASDDSLTYWLWGILDNPVHQIEFVRKKEDPQLYAVAYFEQDVDFRRLACSLKAVTLDGLLVEPDFVSQPRSVLISNFPVGTHRDLVSLCFGNYGGVQEVREIVPQQWIVTFFQARDAARACREKITFRGVELRRNPFVEFCVQTDARKKGKRGRLVFTLEFVDRAVVTFVLAKMKAALDNMLQPFGSTVSTDEDQGVPAVICSLSPSDPRYRDVVQRWQTLQEACLTFFSPFRSMSIPMSTSVYEALVASERFLSMSNQSQSDVLVTRKLNEDQTLGEVILAGSSQAMEEVCSAMQSLVKDISDSMERSKQRVTQVTDHLSESALKLLDAIGFCKSARTCHTELNVDLDWGNRVIRFEGLPGDIAASSEEIKRILSGSSEDTVKGSAAMLALLEKDEIRKFVDEQLKLKQLTDSVVWYLKPSIGICIRGVDSQSTNDAAAVFRTQIIDTPIALDVDSVQLIASEKWETFSHDIIKRYHDNLVLSKGNSNSDKSGAVLEFSCKVTDSERVAEEVKEFLRRNTLKEDFVSLPSMMLEFLTRFMQDSVISHIEQSLFRNFVKLNPVRESVSNPAKTGLKILGNEDGIINAKRRLASLLKTNRVSTKQHKILCPGAEQHFKSQETVFTRMGNETSTIISLSSGTDEEMELHLDESGLLIASKVSLPCGTELHVLRGDVVQLNCDAIVNPANGELQHRGGLAAVIAQRGGQIILDECTAFVSEHGQLIDGQVCVTAAGALRCKKVIHAVGPQWQGGTRNEANKLFSAVQNSLAAAVQQGLTSIAIPPISSGIFNYPLEKCTRTIVESIIDFCASAANRLKKIILVDNKNDGARHFTQAVDELVNKTKVTQAAARGAVSLSTVSQLSSKASSKLDEPDKKFELRVDTSDVQISCQISLPGGTELHVLRGDIVQLSCDVIVNPTNGQLQLKGGLAGVIANKGGQSILDECAAFVRDHGQLSDGQVCVTAAGDLRCKKLVHAVGPRWQGGTRNEENTLFSAVKNALAAASEHDLSSIAIPPISSGIFGYPLEKCTRTIVESVMDFCTNAAKAPRKIFLIDNKSEGAEWFKKAVGQLIINASDTAAQAAAGSLSSSVDALQTTAATLGNLNEPVKAAQTPARQPFTIGNVVVELIEGSLVDQKVDVMVNTVGSQLLLDQGALSKCVGVAAGPAMQQYLTSNYKNGLAAGEVGYSDGFQLPCQYVFHCCCSYWKSGNAGQVLSDLLLKCLTEAARRCMSSVAIPAIGTGQLGFPPQESARVTYEAVLLYCRRHPSSSVRHVKILVHSPPLVVAAYQAQHAAVVRDSGVPASPKAPQSTTPARGRGTMGTGSILRRSSGSPSFSVTLKICGKADDIETAIKALEGYCQKNMAEYIVPGQEESWKMLSGSQWDALVQQGVDDGVAIEVDQRNGRVIIRSLERSAATTLQLQVGNIMTSQQVERLQQENVASRCQWQFRKATEQWQDYDPSLNAKLEQAFRAREKSLSYSSKDGQKYIVHFTDMKDYLEGNTANNAEVQRVDKEQGFLSDLTTKDKYSEVVVTSGSQEYDKVKDAFFKTADPTLNIVEIKRIRNLPLLKQYEIQAIKVQENMQRNNTNLPVERWLWHGTDEDSLQKICQHGFNRSYCGIHGVYHGQGVYFARDSSYSAQDRYSKPNPAGLKHMIYCRVLTGEFVAGNPQMRTPPPRPYGNQANYDSTVDDVNNPAAFVIYHDAQAYPEFVVKFR